MIIISTQKKTGIADEAIYNFVMQSFQQWKDNGLEASFLNYSLEQFKTVNQHATFFVALDDETGELLGTHSFTKNRKKKYVFGNWLAVSPKAQHTGIATQMLEYEAERIRKAGYNYTIEKTAVPAIWSVKWHLKNGYRIIGYERSPSNNYYNYVFRKQLTPSLLWSSPLAPITARTHFIISYAITRLCKTSTGEFTWLGRIAKKFLNIFTT